VKYIDRIARRMHYSPLRPNHALEAAIKAVQPDIIIPCDDRAVRDMHALAGHADGFVAACLERSLGPPDKRHITTSRIDLMREASRLDVPVPPTWPLVRRADLSALADRLAFPWVIKADGTWAGAGVRIVHKLSDAEAAYDEMSQPVSTRTAISEAIFDWDLFWFRSWLKRTTHPLTVQQYIHGFPANCAVAADRGKIIGFTGVEVVRAEHKTGPATVVRVMDKPVMRQSAAAIVASVGYTGICGFDFMIETATAIPYMIEMNPRNVPLAHIALGPGRDLVEAIAALAENRPVRQRASVTDRDLITYFPFSWQRDNTDRVMNTTYQDVPWEEQRLLLRLMRPHMRDHLVFREARRLLRRTRKQAVPAE
jgi:carbamoylphosphate synthase large subunit